ncbi:hypothetical protein I6A84_29510 [Frankia sp. CNm7]|uniref:Uncharacterized protein n=1 Tax=Frankia nepalensis TaxID=1836974 RepID=A0A937USU7_9ACTN|nr:DUF4286 family protein [Frankia nepalensis]MBL7498448.1 hypothetical protein [Frankia nepalensis]MBL7509471.1 hypothetical protein [Frankia nepalensis]MBL7522102.1 hypothetical protein [Frankia nepalensis]MBL7629281.1 hypothetical protein [Frankia nepalensis]
MTSGVLIVESRPASPEEAAAYHDWYDNTHLPEILKVEGFVSARRLESLDGDTFLVIYEIDGDVETAKAALGQAQASGTMSRPQGVELTPPPIVRYFRYLGPAS